MDGLNFYIEQFKTEIYDIYKAYRFSHFGLYNLRGTFNDYEENNDIENFKIVDKECDIEIKFTKQDMQEAKEHGFYQKIMAGNTIAMIYNLWEDRYREIFSKNKGLKNKKELQNDFFGDLNLIRQSITHNHYKRTSEINKLKMLSFLFPEDMFILDSFTVHEIYSLTLKNLDALKTA
ncbi:hypothetical protein CLU96_3530 [Chryseobacterium sp. 52]|uniref:hypothetical protein n=1 Tax=Chryseobacterium sp. 52 TaxID=2035213 RepID=UPI000C17FA52|nr:hypothetical protein [Chryseobacterium sp. 52]PIF46492.1 hypothetical protein CLU96_3530 [Chryseobacterium sp. 52]